MNREKINRVNMTKVKKINFIGFLIGWVIVMFLGSDFPPPVGFVYLIIYIFFIDIIQVKYLDYFCKNAMKKRFLLKHILISGLFGVILSIIPSITELNKTLDRTLLDNFIWIGVVTIVAIFYGIFYYILNKWLIKKYN